MLVFDSSLNHGEVEDKNILTVVSSVHLVSKTVKQPRGKSLRTMPCRSKTLGLVSPPTRKNKFIEYIHH